MSYDLGTARGVIEIGYNGRGVDQAKHDIKSLEGTSTSTQDKLKGIGDKAGVAGLAIAGGLALAVKTAGDFEQQMSNIQAVSGATGDQMDALRGKALQLGQDTQFSASEAAGAIGELVKAGVPVKDVLDGAADSAVNLAAATGIELPQAAEVMSNAMNTFHIKSKDLNSVVDDLARAANATAADVPGLQEALAQAGTTAHGVGLSFHDTVTALGLLANAGIKGSDAGTSLKTMLQNLQPQTKKQADLMKKLGIITKDGNNKFFDAQGHIKSFAKVSGVLQDALKGQSDKQKQANLRTMFGTDAMRAATIMADQGRKGVNKLNDAMSKSPDAAKQAKTRMDNFKGSLEQMKGSLETAGIAIGTALLPPLRKIVDAITKALNWFDKLPSGVQKAIGGTVAAIGGILVGIAVFAKLGRAIRDARDAFKILKGAFSILKIGSLLTNPIGIAIIVIGLLIGAIIILWKHSETFRKIVKAAWSAVKTAIKAVVDWFTNTAVPALKRAWDAVKNAAQAVARFFTNAWNGIKDVVRTVVHVIAAIIRTYINIWKSIITGGINLIKRVVTGAWNAIRRVTSTVWNAIKSAVSNAWNAIRNGVSNAANAVRNAISNAWNAVKSATSNAWDAVVNAVHSAVDRVADAARSIKDRVLGALSGAASWLYNAGKQIIQGLINGIASMAGAVIDKVKSIVGSIAGFLPGSPVKEGPLRVLNDGYAGAQIVRMVTDGMEGQLGSLADAASTMATAAARPLSTPPPVPGRVRFPDRLRLNGPLQVRGRLSLSDGGAYIEGIAQAVYDANEGLNDSLGRMAG